MHKHPLLHTICACSLCMLYTCMLLMPALNCLLSVNTWGLVGLPVQCTLYTCVYNNVYTYMYRLSYQMIGFVLETAGKFLVQSTPLRFIFMVVLRLMGGWTLRLFWPSLMTTPYLDTRMELSTPWGFGLQSHQTILICPTVSCKNVERSMERERVRERERFIHYVHALLQLTMVTTSRLFLTVTLLKTSLVCSTPMTMWALADTHTHTHTHTDCYCSALSKHPTYKCNLRILACMGAYPGYMLLWRLQHWPLERCCMQALARDTSSPLVQVHTLHVHACTLWKT